MKLLGSLLVALATVLGVNATAVNVVSAQTFTIGTVSPSSGPLEGVGVTVTGTNLQNVYQFKFSNQSRPFTPINNSTLSFDTWSANNGAVCEPIQFIDFAGTTVVDRSFCFQPGPISLSPESATSGSTISLFGSGFPSKEGTIVTIGGVAAEITYFTGSSLEVKVPERAETGPVQVVVTTEGGSTAPVTFTYVEEPTLTEIDPNEGPAAGNEWVGLTGSGFVEGETTVMFGWTELSGNQVTFIDSEHLQVQSPTDGSGYVDVSVTTPGGTTGELTYTYFLEPNIDEILPDVGSDNGGDDILIRGSEFMRDGTTVAFDGITLPDADVTYINSGELQVVTPPGTGAVDITVTTPAGTTANAGYFEYLAQPEIASLSASTGPTAGGTTVVLTISNFYQWEYEVTVDGTPVAPTSVDSGSVTITMPAHAAGDAAIVVETPGGASDPATFTYSDVPTATSLAPVEGPAGTIVTINGALFVSGATVSFDNVVVPAISVDPAGTSLTVEAPGSLPDGPFPVVVTTPAGSTAPLTFTYKPAAPTITLLSPYAGPIAGNQEVEIQGTNFIAGETTVKFGDTLAVLDTVSENLITLRTPRVEAIGDVAVVVTTPGGSVTATLPYTYYEIPTIDAIDPSRGSTAGGETVTLYGTGFVEGVTSVTFGGDAGTEVDVIDGNTLTVTTPAHAAGLVTVRVTINNVYWGERSNGYLYVNSPSISAIGPNIGPAAGGQSITITGANFVTGATIVSFGGTPVAATVQNAGTLTVTTPAGSGTVNVTVGTAGGTATATGGYIYAEVPTIGSLSPDSGPTHTATKVTVTGTGFVAGQTSVTIDGLTTILDEVSSPTQLIVWVPQHTAGTVPLVVTTPGGSAEANFTYAEIPAPTVTSLSSHYSPTSGGKVINVTGTNFIVGGTSVFLQGDEVTPQSVTTTSFSFTTPPRAAGRVDFDVATIGGAATTEDFYYVDPPEITGFSPTGGAAGAVPGVTIDGVNFVPGQTSVTFGGVAATITAIATTAVTVDGPALSAGEVDIIVTTPGGSVMATEKFTYAVPPAPPTVTGIDPAYGPSAGGTTVTVTGTGFTGASVKLGSSAVTANIVSDTELTFITPAGSGAADVTVTGTNGTSATSPDSTFTYYAVPTATALDPVSGPPEGGNIITVTGSNFVDGVTEVKMGSATITPTSVSANSLSFIAPSGVDGASAAITVTTPGGTSDLLTYNYVEEPPPTASPSITSMTPTSGPTAGGTTIVITGANFLGTTQVYFGSAGADMFSVDSATQITAVSPAGATGTVDVVVEVDTESSATSAASKFTYADIAPPSQGSIDVETVQQTFSSIANRSSSQAITGAVNRGISIGFGGGSALDVALESAFVAYAPTTAALGGIVEAEQLALGDDRWSLWLDTTGSGLVDLVTGSDSSGWQINVTGGMGLRLSESFLVGAIAGYERFAYSGTAPVGTLSGQGYSLGAYFGAKATANVLVDLSVVWTGLGYDAASGAAEGSFDAARWLMSGGLAGSYELGDGLVIKPSARLQAMWEQQSSWTDSLSATHDGRDFGQARLSAGLEISRALPIADGWELVPSIGAFADLAAAYDSATAAATEDVSARLSTGVDIRTDSGASLSLGGELSGIGTNLLTWSLQGRAGAKF